MFFQILLYTTIFKTMKQDDIIQLNHFTKLKFKANPAEIKQIFPIDIEQSFDTKLIYKGTGLQPCKSIQVSLQFHTHTMTLISDQEFNEQEFDPSTPINFRTFLAMAQIKDGIISLTSDLVVYMIKFNERFVEQQVPQNYQFNDPNSFATVIWKADLQRVLPVQSDLPQLLYSSEYNEMLILLPQLTLFLSVSDMEQNNNEVKLIPVIDMKPRNYRGWTIQIGRFIYSAVGEDGVDVYQVSEESMKSFFFYTTLTKENLFGNTNQSHIEDIMAFSFRGKKYMYMVDYFQGIQLYQIQDTGELSIFIQNIGQAIGGIALDALGPTLVCIYESFGRYKAVEYYVNLDTNSWIIVRTFYSSSKLLDVKLKEGIALLQGIEYSEMFFTGIKQEHQQYNNNKQMKLFQRGVRGQTLYNNRLTSTSKIAQRVNISGNEFLENDIILGVTNQRMFLSRFRKQPSHIECFWENDSLLNEEFEYDVLYNSSTCDPHPNKDLFTICQQLQGFQLIMVEVLMRRIPQGLVIGLVVGAIMFITSVLLCVIFIHRKHSKEAEQQRLRMEEFSKKRQSNKLNDSKNNDSSFKNIDLSGSMLKIEG